MSQPVVFDIGNVVIRNDLCFWILPTCYISNTNICSIQSPHFTYFKEKWRLVLHPRYGVNEMSLQLWREFHYDLTSCKYSIQIKLKTTNGCTIGVYEGELTHDDGFEALINFSSTSLLECSNIECCGQVKIFFSISEKHDIGDVLTPGSLEAKSNKDYKSSEDEVSCEDEVSSDEEDNEEKLSSRLKGMQILSRNLNDAFLERNMTDAVLIVDGREYAVHKLILCARSPVFESMFSNNFTEKKTNEVIIPDCNAMSFEVFLHYLYSGSAETLSASTVLNVYYAADKYGVKHLKKVCVKFMKRCISEETVCGIIALAFRHSELKLQKYATKFFCENLKKIIKTEEWKNYLQENFTQANNLLITAINA